MIEIRNLDKFYNKGSQNEIHVINNVTLSLPEKGMVAIFGKSGCGKTTLLNVIGGLDKANSGDVKIKGESLKSNTDKVRNSSIGYIFQNYNLNKSETALENVADALRLLGMKDEKELEQRAENALRLVGMAKFKKRLPDTLSGGQQQRIAIARAIVKNPDIILADEPTGNLDESNTVMIMDLLAEIAKEHLVLLVTHEEKLVDYYCNTVIELKDGNVENIRENESKGSYIERDKNTVYLGEYEKRTEKDEICDLEYYGELPDKPIKIKIVNLDGKLVLRVDSDDVRVLSKQNELVFKEGVFENTGEKAEKEEGKKLDMSSLPKVEGKNFGKLFTFKNAFRSGFKVHFGKKNKLKKALVVGLVLFSMTITFMIAKFATSIDKIFDVQDSYNHNGFYIKAPDAYAVEILKNATEENSGIDYIQFVTQLPHISTYYFFNTGYFETFGNEYNIGGMGNFGSPGMMLPMTMLDSEEVLSGSIENLDRNSIVITRKIADILISKATVDYIKDYQSLIGLSLKNQVGETKENMRIVAVVEGSENAFYFDNDYVAKVAFYAMGLNLSVDKDNRVEKGKVVFIKNADGKGEDVEKVIEKGSKIKIVGEEFEVQNVIIKGGSLLYREWLELKGYKKDDQKTYFTKKVSDEFPTLDTNSEEFYQKRRDYQNENYVDYLLYFADKFDEFIYEQTTVFTKNYSAWLYNEKNVDVAKYDLLADDELYKAELFKAENGRYPTEEEIKTVDCDLYSEYNKYNILYQNEFKPYNDNRTTTTVVNIDDANKIISTYKESDEVVLSREYSPTSYAIIHSKNPEKTDKWLRENCDFASFDRDDLEYSSPENEEKSLMEDVGVEILIGNISLVVVIVFMCLCMYFIMRSSIMTRIKDIGIFRAIGVSKKNVLFRFTMEAVVLITLTVLPGFLISSIFVKVALGASSTMGNLFFYPLWIAVPTIAFLYLLGIICGILPVVNLLRKTPSEILAKYDI